MTIKENLDCVTKKIREAEARSGRAEGSVKLLAVSKFHPKEAVLEAMEAGQKSFGENRVQEAVEKFGQIDGAELHIIGSLQRNKVKNAIKVASVIESVDRIELLEEIEKQCAKIEKTIRVFFELHTGEESKAGFESAEKIREALALFASGAFPHIVPSGFMTMAPFSDDKDLVRRSFITLREVSQALKKEYPQFPLNELSMGMSGDFEIAIEEGSTEVRIGTAIFGERHYE